MSAYPITGHNQWLYIQLRLLIKCQLHTFLLLTPGNDKKIVKPNVLVLTWLEGLAAVMAARWVQQRHGGAARGDSSVFDQSTDL